MLPSTTSPVAMPISLAVWVNDAADPARSWGAWEMTSFMRYGNTAPMPAVARTLPQITTATPDGPAGMTAYATNPAAMTSRTTLEGRTCRPSQGPRFDATIIASI